MRFDHLFLRHIVEFSDIFHVVADAKGFSAFARPRVVIECRNGHLAARQVYDLAGRCNQLLQSGNHFIARPHQRVVNDAERADLRIGFHKAARWMRTQADIEGQDAKI